VHTYYASKYYSKLRLSLPFRKTRQFVIFKTGYLLSVVAGLVGFGCFFAFLFISPDFGNLSFGTFAFTYLPLTMGLLFSLSLLTQMVAGAGWLKLYFDLTLSSEAILVLYTSLPSANFAIYLALVSSFTPLFIVVAISWLLWRYDLLAVSPLPTLALHLDPMTWVNEETSDTGRHGQRAVYRNRSAREGVPARDIREGWVPRGGEEAGHRGARLIPWPYTLPVHSTMWAGFQTLSMHARTWASFPGWTSPLTRHLGHITKKGDKC